MDHYEIQGTKIFQDPSLLFYCIYVQGRLIFFAQVGHQGQEEGTLHLHTSMYSDF